MASHQNHATLSELYLHFVQGDKRENDNIVIKKTYKRKKTKLNNNYDELFFNFLLIVKMDSLTPDYNKNVEIKLKYEFAQKMENMKFKKLDNVINNLCYESNINLKTLSALCNLFSKTMIYSSCNVFVSLNKCEENQIVYLVKKDLSIICVKKETLEGLRKTSYEVQNIDHPFYSITHYKLAQLNEIASTIGLVVDGRKKDIYGKITEHLSNAIF